MNWEQLKAILWLRWQLTRNQFIRAGSANIALSILWITLLTVAAMGLGAGGLIGGWAAGAKASAPVLLLIWDGVIFAFLIIWGSGLMVEIQRSESIDLPKLLHLPVTLQQVFLFNYAVSHLSASMVLCLPALLGFCAGLVIGGGAVLALSFPLVLGFIFMLTAWSYCLRGWLAALMMNKRRRRAIIVWVTIIFVLVCQLPNLLFNSGSFFNKGRNQKTGNWLFLPGKDGGLRLHAAFVQGHLILPPGWVGYGTMAMKERNPWPALGAVAASCLLGALGLRKAYRITLRFYQGADNGEVRAVPRPKQAQPTTSASSRVPLLERRLPGLPEDAAALALATFRSLSRAPELKMAFIMPLVMGIIMSSMFFTRPKEPLAQGWIGFIMTGAVVFAVFSMAPTMANVFGIDRSGFRSLVLLPTRREYVLLAKNLAFFPFTTIVVLVLLATVAVLLRASWDTVLTALFQAPTAFLLFSLLGNLTAILAPYRMAPGSLQAKKPKPIIFLVILLNFLVTPFVALPLVIPPALKTAFAYVHWVPWLPVNILAAAGLLAAAAVLYWSLLPPLGRLLQRREQIILREVTEETE